MNELAIIVMSCDKYQDAWHPFYHFLKKYWSDCPYPIYHVSESLSPRTKFKTINILTGNLVWSAMLEKALEKISEKYILLLLEDYFLLKPVNNLEIEKCIEIIENEKASCLRIFPCPAPDMLLHNNNYFGIINVKNNNGLNSQATIWEKTSLKKLVDINENIGDFEKNINSRAEKLENKFLCVNIKGDENRLENGDYPYTYLCTAIVQGKWTKEAVDLCKKENILLDVKQRKIQTKLEAYYYKNYPSISPFLRKIIYFFISKK